MFVPLPEPYDFALSTERFRRYGEDLATRFREGALYRVLAGRELSIAPVSGGVEVDALEPSLRPAVERLLGLPFDLASFEAFAAGDAVLAALLERRRGFRPLLLPDPFEMLVTAISAQQLSMAAALAIRNRLTLAFGEPATFAFAFPRRERIAAAEPSELVALGFSRSKARSLVELAQSTVDLAALADASDEEVRASLTALPGIGPWTAEWFLARHLGRPRAWPEGDLALRKAADLFYGVEVRELGRRLDPFQNLAAHYLLSALAMP